MLRFLAFSSLLSLTFVACAQSSTVLTEDDGGTTPTADSGGCNTFCNNVCVDLKTDSANCGKCGTACPMGATCVQGSCQCPSGLSRCGNACLDVKSDTNNCGKCGTVCGGDAGAIMGGGTWGCTNGACSIVCPQPKKECSGACVDTATDNDNCGMCGNSCISMTEQCMQGQCCKTGEQICNMTCTSVQTDPMNCGMCGKQCTGMTPICAGGMCTAYQVVGTLGNKTFYKVPVVGAMTDVNTKAACVGAGLKVGCTSTGNCQYNDAQCVMTNENQCFNPMYALAQAIGCNSPGGCMKLNGVYQNMGGNWVNGSSCGVEGNSWCSQGNMFMNKFALCTQ